MKKSKPKRTNWKQRALTIQGGFDALSVAHTGLISAYNELSVKEHGFRTRAESAEKHNALLLEERQRHENVLVNQSLDNFTMASNSAHATVTIYDKYIPQNPPTHWQRFKSWLSRRGK